MADEAASLQWPELSKTEEEVDDVTEGWFGVLIVS